MRVRAIVRTCDAELPGGKMALFEGQEYDLPVEAAQPLIDAGKAVEVKAVHGPPEDKAVEPAQDKAPRRWGRRTRKTT